MNIVWLFLKRFLSSIPLILIGLMFLNFIFPTGSWCRGMGTILMGFLLIGLYLIFFVVIYSIALWRYNRHKHPVNSTPFYISISLIFIYYALSLLYPNYILGRKVMEGYLHNNSQHERISITLRGNNTYDLDIYGADFGCTDRGTYEMSNDTLKLNGEAIKADAYTIGKSRKVLSDKYLIDTLALWWYPIDSVNSTKDTSRWLKMAYKYQIKSEDR